MNLPDNEKQLTTYEEVYAAWGGVLTVAPEDIDPEEQEMEESEEGGTKPKGIVLFAGNDRVAITAEAVYVKLRKAVHSGPRAELSDLLRIPEPTVNELKMTDRHKGDIAKAVCLLTSVCGIPAAEANGMGAGDFRLCSEVVSAFL